MCKGTLFGLSWIILNGLTVTQNVLESTTSIMHMDARAIRRTLPSGMVALSKDKQQQTQSTKEPVMIVVVQYCCNLG